MTPLTMIIHGDPGNGKSTLANSGPAPRLIIDAESGAHHAHRVVDGQIELANIIRWDPMQPIPKQCADTCIVSITRFDQLAPVLQQLQTEDHPFKTIIVDSITEMQQRLHAKIRKDNSISQMRKQDWGTSKTDLTTFVRDIRDLSVHPTHPVPVIVFVALSMTREDENGRPVKWPNLEGGASANFPGSVDISGFVRIATDEDGVEQQGLLLHGNPAIIAKTRSPKVRMIWGSQVINPNLEQMFNSIQEEEV